MLPQVSMLIFSGTKKSKLVRTPGSDDSFLLHSKPNNPLDFSELSFPFDIFMFFYKVFRFFFKYRVISWIFF